MSDDKGRRLLSGAASLVAGAAFFFGLFFGVPAWWMALLGSDPDSWFGGRVFIPFALFFTALAIAGGAYLFRRSGARWP